MKRPNETVLKKEERPKASNGGNMRRAAGMALLIDDKNIFEMLRKLAPVIGGEMGAQMSMLCAAREKAAAADLRFNRAESAGMPLTELQRMEKLMEFMKKMMGERRNVDELIRMIHLGDEVSRKGSSALLPLMMKDADPMAAMLMKMMSGGGGDMQNMLGKMMGGDMMKNVMNMMGNFGAI